MLERIERVLSGLGANERDLLSLDFAVIDQEIESIRAEMRQAHAGS